MKGSFLLVRLEKFLTGLCHLTSSAVNEHSIFVDAINNVLALGFTPSLIRSSNASDSMPVMSFIFQELSGISCSPQSPSQSSSSEGSAYNNPETPVSHWCVSVIKKLIGADIIPLHSPTL